VTAQDPRQLESHFAFGENWQSFLKVISPQRIDEAKRSLRRLFPADEIKGRRFLDIGCGSGLFMLAAMESGARSVEGVDIDPNSVAAAKSLLSRYHPNGQWSVRVASVFELAPETNGTFDIVYSWGVLHHTGDMWTAIGKAAALVAPGGLFAVALYRKTPLCGFWRHEKKFYSAAEKPTQAMIRYAYQSLYCAGLLATGRNPIRYVRDYHSARGMDWSHNVHDWLGGYPYESVQPAEVEARLEGLGFRMARVFEKPAAALGLFGSHCDEFVAVRRS